MERLLRAEDIAERYSCSVKTARKYMRQMRHTEAPLTVTEAAVLAWDAKRTIDPDAPRTGRPYKKTAMPAGVIPGHVPRWEEVFGGAQKGARKAGRPAR